VLDMTVEEGASSSPPCPPSATSWRRCSAVGLGYIQGRPAGDDALGRRGAARQARQGTLARATGRTLYILDEPTTGLHFHDVAKLLEVLHELVDQGNTVVVIEHNLEVIKTADWIIDLGPEGGDGGGEIVVGVISVWRRAGLSRQISLHETRSPRENADGFQV
jgi:excinuclease ABC subunit A